jgi:glutathione S-transferase
MDTIILYEFSGCPFCRKARAALRYKNIPFTRKIVKTTAEYAELGRLNPSRQAPVLVQGDKVVTDSTDILQYIEEKWPKPTLFPGGANNAALTHFLEDWADEALSWYGSTFRWIDPRNNKVANKQLRISETKKGPFAVLFPRMGQLVGRIRALGQGIGRRPLEKLERDLIRHIDELAKAIQNKPYIFGDEISAADLSIWAQLRSLRFCTQEKLAVEHPVLGPYLARMDTAVGDGE